MLPFCFQCEKKPLLPVVVDVADNDSEQAQEEYDSGGIDDWMQGLDAGRKILHTAEVL